MDRLAFRFHNELIEKMHIAKKECHYNPTRFNQMISEIGGVETAKKLIDKAMRKGDSSDGFRTLYILNRLDLTMEDSVCKEEYQTLFSKELIEYCRHLLNG